MNAQQSTQARHRGLQTLHTLTGALAVVAAFGTAAAVAAVRPDTATPTASTTRQAQATVPQAPPAATSAQGFVARSSGS